MAEKIEPTTTVDDEIKEMLSNINKSFQKKYDLKPDFFVRVPGRVNLIGEHVDYCGYPVCPMAIKQCFVAAVKSTKNLDVVLSNVENVKYPDFTCKINNLPMKDKSSESPPNWYDYVLCGLKGVLELSRNAPNKGLMIHLHGTIPPASGLSSSSALVCCAALALGVVLDTCPPRNQMAELTARAERYIGTEGGGMDQAIIFNAKRGMASHIQFDPLRFNDVQIPAAGTFVIAQSMVTKNKAASNDFNSRVVETRLAALIIGKHHLKNWRKFLKLSDVQRELKFDFAQMLKVIQSIFHNGFYTKSEVCQILDVTEKELDSDFLTPNTRHINTFKIKPRALHVIGEALRVQMFCDICDGQKSLEELGRLMTESHVSLKDLYECSHVELDKLVAVCSISGALGARLTGAGWGGCVVALVPLGGADEFVKSVKAAFYAGKVSGTSSVDHLIFITKPYNGASVISTSVVDD